MYELVKYLHVIGACVLLGTGAGIAFFMVAAHATKDAVTIAAVARIVVIADFVFTASAVIIQPITGIALAELAGFALGDAWLFASIGLYLVAGLFWLPVVRMQMRMRDLALAAAARREALPAAYHRLFRLWFACGIPAFGAVLAIIALMIVKPASL